jgi:AcrR family transcriptional regulator
MKSSSAPYEGDLRVRRTRKLLWEALVAEMAERPFEEISVKDICERAMVHRTTFYAHYEDKYALLEQGIRQMIEELAPQAGHQAPGAYSVAQPPPYFVRVFEQAAEHQGFYRLMVCGEGNAQFQRLVRQSIIDVALATVAPGNERLAVAMTMHAHYMAGAVLGLLDWWLENGMPLTPFQMAQYLMAPHGVPNAVPTVH